MSSSLVRGRPVSRNSSRSGRPQSRGSSSEDGSLRHGEQPSFCSSEPLKLRKGDVPDKYWDMYSPGNQFNIMLRQQLPSFSPTRVKRKHQVTVLDNIPNYPTKSVSPARRRLMIARESLVDVGQNPRPKSASPVRKGVPRRRSIIDQWHYRRTPRKYDPSAPPSRTEEDYHGTLPHISTALEMTDILRKMSYGSFGAKKEAVVSVEYLAGFFEGRSELVRLKGHLYLFDVLRLASKSGDYEAMESILEGLAQLSTNPEGRKHVAENGGLRIPFRILRLSRHPGLRRSCVNLLRSLAANPEYSEEIGNRDGVLMIMESLKREKKRHERSGLLAALTMLVRDCVQNKKQALELELVEYCCHMIERSHDTQLSMACTSTLCSLSMAPSTSTGPEYSARNNNSVYISIVERGGLATLSTMAKNIKKDHVMLKTVLDSMCSLCMYDYNRRKLLEFEFLDFCVVTVDEFQSNSIRSAVLRILRMLARESRCRDAIVEHEEVFSWIVDICTRSIDPAVLHSVLCLISVISSIGYHPERSRNKLLQQEDLMDRIKELTAFRKDKKVATEAKRTLKFVNGDKVYPAA